MDKISVNYVFWPASQVRDVLCKFEEQLEVLRQEFFPNPFAVIMC